MKELALFAVCSSLIVWASSAAEPNPTYYRVFKAPVEDYQGVLAPGSPPPTNSITLIDLDGYRRGPFYKDQGYVWVEIPKPGRTRLLPFAHAEMATLTNALLLGTNYIALVSPDNQTRFISSDLHAELPLITSNLSRIFDGATLRSIVEKSNLNLTYRIQNGKVTAALSGWNTGGSVQEVQSNIIRVDPKVLDTIQKK